MQTKETHYNAFLTSIFYYASPPYVVTLPPSFCCYTPPPSLSPNTSPMSPNTIPYFGSSNPYIVSSMNRNYCVHPYSHIPKANGLEPQNKKKTVYTWSFLKQKNTFSYKEIFKTDNHGISSPAKTFCLYKVYIFFLNLTCLGDTSKEIRTEPSKPHFTAKKPIFHIQFNYLRDFTLAAVTPCNCFSISSGK